MEEGLIIYYFVVLFVKGVLEFIEFYCFMLGFELFDFYGNLFYYVVVKGGEV